MRKRPLRLKFPHQQPVLFVDVDGVLNSTDWFLRTTGDPIGDRIPAHRPDLRVDPECVRRLKRLERALDASLVLSSNWRRSMSFNHFADLCYAISGSRPFFVGQTYVYGEVLPSVRKKEIVHYAKHIGAGNRFAALDDMELNMPEHVWINPNTGLTDDHVDEVVRRFK